MGVASDDPTALHCKIVCLIQVSKFDEALKFIDKNKLLLPFEKAYCEYRQQQPEKSLATIDTCNISPMPINLKELRAQVLYRLEQFDESLELYKDLMKNTSDDFDEERKTNLSAVAANVKDEFPNLPEDTYEMCFNSSCNLSSRNKFSEAEKKLKLSEKLCREMLEEDGATEEEIAEELSTIKVQQAYCMQMQGKSKEPSLIYSECLKNKPKDAVLVAVASNNSVVLNKDQNLFDSKKKIRSAMAEACEQKLTSKQKKSIALNNCLLALFSGSSEQTLQLCNKFIQKYPDSEFEGILIKSTQLSKEKKYKDAVDQLEKFASSHKDRAFATKFAIIQLLLLQGNRKEAVEVFTSLGESKYKPGVVSALVTLYLGLDNKPAASEILKSAVDWYKKNASNNSGDLSDMWRQAAEFHLRGGEAETAAKSLEELLKINPNDVKVLAQLVIAYAQFNAKKAQEISKRLPALETLTTASEIDALEAANWVMSIKAAKKSASAKAEQSPGTPGSDLQKKKTKSHRKRKGKLPNNYNADVAPDPERWLPRYERSGYRKKRDRRAKDVIKGSQGVSNAATNQL